MAYQTSSFSIAHYILLIAMVIACGGVVAYAIIHDTGAYEDIFSNPRTAAPIPAKLASDECRQRVTNAVAQMWAYNPDVVPEKYRDIAMSYFTTTLNTTTSGECNGIQFICRPGNRRADCDPCAASNARDYAISVQTRDMIQKHCTQ